jgi:hypothetical protein
MYAVDTIVASRIFSMVARTLAKEPRTGSEVSAGTLASQLLYEIQGPQYYGSDVVAVLETLEMHQEGKDKVYICGIKGNPPPTTTHVGISAGRRIPSGEPISSRNDSYADELAGIPLLCCRPGP